MGIGDGVRASEVWWSGVERYGGRVFFFVFFFVGFLTKILVILYLSRNDNTFLPTNIYIT